MSATPDTELPTRHAFASRAAEKARRRELWAQALRQRSVWLRAAKLGLTAGFVQAAVNQGDHRRNDRLDDDPVIKLPVQPVIALIDGGLHEAGGQPELRRPEPDGSLAQRLGP